MKTKNKRSLASLKRLSFEELSKVRGGSQGDLTGDNGCGEDTHEEHNNEFHYDDGGRPPRRPRPKSMLTPSIIPLPSV